MNIKKIRRSFFMTQAEFAKEIGVSLQTVWSWENGKRSVSMQHMKQIARFCRKHKVDLD